MKESAEPVACSACGGSGRTDNHVTGEIECALCSGEGIAPPSLLAENARLREAGFEHIAYEAAREELSEYDQQDDYLLAHGASLLSDESHEIFHTDALRRVVRAVIRAALKEPK